MNYEELLKDAVPCKGFIRVPDEEKTRLKNEKLLAEGKSILKKPMMRSIPCRHKPHIVKMGDLFYVQCSHCNKWDPYAFLGTNAKTAIKQWNEYNSKNFLEEEDY